MYFKVQDMIKSVARGAVGSGQPVGSEVLHEQVLGAVMWDGRFACASHGMATEFVGLMGASTVRAGATLYDGALETESSERTELAVRKGTLTVRGKGRQESRTSTGGQIPQEDVFS